MLRAVALGFFIVLLRKSLKGTFSCSVRITEVSGKTLPRGAALRRSCNETHQAVLAVGALVVAMLAMAAGPVMAAGSDRCRDLNGDFVRCDGELFVEADEFESFDDGFFFVGGDDFYDEFFFDDDEFFFGDDFDGDGIAPVPLPRSSARMTADHWGAPDGRLFFAL